MEKEKNNLTKLKAIIEETTGKEAKIIAVPSELIHFTKKTQKAVFLAQLIYWSDRGKRTDKFIYKTRKEWTEETGLSAVQIDSYTKEFRELGILKTKLKKANGNPTVHYKLEMDVFLKSFAQFSSNRISNKLENQSQETDESLTENTPENSPDILSSSQNSNEFCPHIFTQEKEIFNKEENVIEKVFQDSVIDNINQQCSARNNDLKVIIPDDFSPSVENQYKAVTEFPDKSPAFVTLKFVRHYQDKAMKLTLREWQQKWWEWMTSESPFYDKEKLENEHNEIQDIVRNQFYQLSYVLHRKLFHRDHFWSVAIKYYSGETIEDCLKWLVESENFACIDDTFFLNIREYNESPKWKARVVEEAKVIAVDLSSIE